MKRNIEMIVIASHGKSGLHKYFIGSVAEKVMKEAPCPALLVRTRSPDQGGPPEA